MTSITIGSACVFHANKPTEDQQVLTEREISAWREELSALTTERSVLQREASTETPEGEPGPASRALAALDLRKQRLIWSIRESEQLLRSHRRRPLAASLSLEDIKDDELPTPPVAAAAARTPAPPATAAAVPLSPPPAAAPEPAAPMSPPPRTAASAPS